MSKVEKFWMRDNFRKTRAYGRTFTDTYGALDAGVYVRGFSDTEDLPKIAFYYRDLGNWIACDNRTGRAWIREFERETDAIAFCMAK